LLERRWWLVEANVLEIERLAVNAFYWGSDPVGEFAEFGDSAAHKGLHVSIVLGTGKPLEFVGLPLFLGEDFAGTKNLTSHPNFSCIA